MFVLSGFSKKLKFLLVYWPVAYIPSNQKIVFLGRGWQINKAYEFSDNAVVVNGWES